jgi:16S rRNA (cytidine1402-2'-O)-methyltransferase
VLLIVSTPIGNLGDISARAIDVLRAADVVLAEDTRKTRVLLEHLGISRALHALHEHNEARMSDTVIEHLQRGETVALVSDAGTPLVSDPGERLARRVIDAGHGIVPIPGASALLAALVVSGFATTPFTFFGFIPRKAGERTDLARTLLTLPHTAVCYESPERVGETLAGWVESGLADRDVGVARELTKMFEEVRRGTVREVAAYHQENPPRGEVVIILNGARPAEVDETALQELARGWREEGLPAREVARRLSEEHGASRNLAYRLAHE